MTVVSLRQALMQRNKGNTSKPQEPLRREADSSTSSGSSGDGGGGKGNSWVAAAASSSALAVVSVRQALLQHAELPEREVPAISHSARP